MDWSLSMHIEAWLSRPMSALLVIWEVRSVNKEMARMILTSLVHTTELTKWINTHEIPKNAHGI